MSRIGSGVPFIARDAELGQLRAALDRARVGSAGAVLVAGDAGVGKSRLLAEFLAEARAKHAHVLVGRCLSVGESGLPYLPFREVVQQLLAERDELVTVRPPLTGLVGLPTAASGPAARGPAGAATLSAASDESDLSQLQLFDAMLGALVELAADAVVVLALEDLHWGDPSTRDLLSFLISRLGSQRLLVVGTYRTDDLHRRHPLRPLLAELVRLPTVERLDLAPFGTDDAVAFVQALADGVVDPELVADVAARSEGNAFFAEELFAASSSSRNGIPTALADVLMARVETLSQAAQRVVGAISVTGPRHVSHAALQAVIDMSDTELEAALRETLQHHILVTDDEGGYTFRHALQREAVYADLLPGERVRLHAAYAKRIRDRGQTHLAATLAYHSMRSNDLSTALVASVQAADNAMRVGALAAELRHVEQALELWPSVEDPATVVGCTELSLVRKAAYVASAAGYPERAVAYAVSAVPLADRYDDPILQADVRRQLAQTQLGRGMYDDAARTIAEAWDLVEDTPPSQTRAWVLALRARKPGGRPVDLERTRSIADQAAADARAVGAAGAEADALVTLAFGYLRSGAIDHACELFEQARERAAQAEAHDVELRAYFNLTVTRHEQGMLDIAAQIADDSTKRASEVGLTWSMYGLELRWMRVMVHYARGSWDQALAASSPPGEQVSDSISALIAAAGAIVKVGLGQFDEAAQVLAQLRPQQHGDSQIHQLAGIAGVEMASWQGRHDAGSTLVDEALAAMRKTSGDMWPLGGIRLATLGVAAQADLLRQARTKNDATAQERARTEGERFASYAKQTAQHGHPRSEKIGPEGLAWLARLRAEESRLAGSLDPQPWREVIDAFGYGEVYHAAIARWRLAEVLVAAGDRDGAATELSTALDTAERLGARPLAGAVRDLARRARIPMAGGGAPGASVAQLLTPREKSVLELVAHGHTNRKIGEELFISEKTVSVHLSRVMTKLDAASRTEAVALAYQRGLLDTPS